MMTATGNIREPQVHYHGIMVRLKFCKDPLWFEITATIWDGFGVSGAHLDSSNAACTTRLACSIVPEGARCCLAGMQRLEPRNILSWNVAIGKLCFILFLIDGITISAQLDDHAV